nr:MAG TPA: hypothetical protein [Caudoviricetes sp.]
MGLSTIPCYFSKHKGHTTLLIYHFVNPIRIHFKREITILLESHPILLPYKKYINNGYRLMPIPTVLSYGFVLTHNTEIVGSTKPIALQNIIGNLTIETKDEQLPAIANHATIKRLNRINRCSEVNGILILYTILILRSIEETDEAVEINNRTINNLALTRVVHRIMNCILGSEILPFDLALVVTSTERDNSLKDILSILSELVALHVASTNVGVDSLDRAINILLGANALNSVQLTFHIGNILRLLCEEHTRDNLTILTDIDTGSIPVMEYTREYLADLRAYLSGICEDHINETLKLRMLIDLKCCLLAFLLNFFVCHFAIPPARSSRLTSYSGLSVTSALYQVLDCT